LSIAIYFPLCVVSKHFAMHGKAMRIVTMCTLAFEICGGRMKDEEKEEEKISRTMPLKTPTKGSSTSRLLAKGLVMGAAVHPASGFGQPALVTSVHPASGFGRPGGSRALEPLNAWALDTLRDGVFKPLKAKLEATRNTDDFKRFYKAFLIEDILNANAAENDGYQRLLHDDLLRWDNQDLEKIWLSVMVEDAERDAEVSGDDARVLKKFEDEQSRLRALEPLNGWGLDTIHDKVFTPLKAGLEAGHHNIDDFKRVYKEVFIEDILNEKGAKNGRDQRFLHHDLLRWDKQDLEKLWLGVMVENAERDAEVSEDDVRVFQKFEESRLRHATISDFEQ